MPTVITTGTSISPLLSISAENLRMWKAQQVSHPVVNGVQPPMVLPGGKVSAMMNMRNLLFPWVDEKLCEPKFDGVAQYLGMPSNTPTPVRDYHIIALRRAVDYLFSLPYSAVIKATTGGVLPAPPPTK